MTVTIKREIDDAEFWSSIMGSSEFPHEWWLKIKYHGEADWDEEQEYDLWEIINNEDQFNEFV